MDVKVLDDLRFWHLMKIFMLKAHTMKMNNGFIENLISVQKMKSNQ